MAIKTVQEYLYEEMDKNIEIAKDKFMKSILPIYGSSINGKPIHIGTSLYIQVDFQKLLLTAAHIVDELKITQLYVGVNSKLLPLEGKFKVTPNVDGSREKDHYDFAYLLLNSDLLSSFKSIPAIDESMISNYDGNTIGRNFVAFGYPNSKNKQINLEKNTVQPKMMKYSSVTKESPSLCTNLGVSGEDHLFLDFDSKYSKDSSGRKVSSINPKGISGGALIDMGEINKQILKITHNQTCKLSALLIENHKSYRLFSATKMNIIVNTIKSILPPNNALLRTPKAGSVETNFREMKG